MGYPRLIHYAASIALGLAAANLRAQQPDTFDTGNGVLAICGSTSPSDNMRCYAFLDGLSEGISVMAIRDKTRKPFCIPAGVTKGQATDIVVKFLRENPERRHLDGTLLVVVSLHSAFPCPEK